MFQRWLILFLAKQTPKGKRNTSHCFDAKLLKVYCAAALSDTHSYSTELLIMLSAPFLFKIFPSNVIFPLCSDTLVISSAPFALIDFARPLSKAAEIYETQYLHKNLQLKFLYPCLLLAIYALIELHQPAHLKSPNNYLFI